MNLDNNSQNLKPKHAGGRPKGSRNKLNILDFFKGGEVELLVRKTIEKAQEDEGSKERVFLIEQVFGKAKQAIIGGDEQDRPLLIEIAEAVAKRNKLK